MLINSFSWYKCWYDAKKWHSMSNEERRQILLNFDRLIQMKAPGNGDAIAAKLGISRSTFFRLIDFMREELNAPIIFDNKNQCYTYSHEGSIVFSFVYDRVSE